MTDTATSVVEAARSRAAEGMEIAAVAALDPNRSAIISEHGNRSFKQLNDRINRIAHLLLDRGYQRGDGIAILSGNRPEFIEVRFAAHRIGARLTTVNWHLSAEEIAYIVDDCDAVALFADVRTSEAAEKAIKQATKLKVSLGFGGKINGFEDYETELAKYPSDDIEQASLGSVMQYTSGTTGRPKACCANNPTRPKRRSYRLYSQQSFNSILIAAQINR
nr:AMP-binding protein [Oceanicoccus sp. KOV_DT_Chl]